MRSTDVAGIAGYLLATPFVVYPALFKRMWNTRDLRLLSVQELGVALIVLSWAARGNLPSAVGNGAYGVGLGVAYAWAGRRR